MSSGVTNPAYAVNEQVLRDFRDVDFKTETTDEEAVSPFEVAAEELHRDIALHRVWIKSRFGRRRPVHAHIVTDYTLGQNKGLAVEVPLLDAGLVGVVDAYIIGTTGRSYFGPKNFSGIISPVHSHSASRRSVELERIITDLGRLRDGWAGPDSKAPKAAVIRDVERVFSAFDNDTAVPNIEVDAEDGSAVMYWQVGREALSLMIGGDGRISGVLSPSRESYRMWVVSGSEIEKLARRLEDPVVAHLTKR